MAGRLTTADRTYLAAGVMLYVALVAPPVLGLLESRMTTHMTVLLPGLALAVYLCGIRLRTLAVSQRWNAAGAPGLIAALFTAAFWMLPRALDESLRNYGTEIGKLVSIPLLAGVLLAISWPALGPICRGVLKVHMISMFAALGWLYSVVPARLCTSYLQSDQEQLGLVLCVMAGVLALAWALPWMFGSNNTAVASWDNRSEHEFFTSDSDTLRDQAGDRRRFDERLRRGNLR
jgi:hypothetical protein